MPLTIAAHCVESITTDGLSWLQHQLLTCEKPIRIADAPTGAGKSFAFQKAMIKQQQRILFIVPTKRLAQNLIRGLFDDYGKTVQKSARKSAFYPQHQLISCPC
ncbi:MAG TPA: hypothetical protein DCM38_08605 [Gammaproteobacteria bacterium]|nr:hypothetical protein [Gammaproteobacteria bacterium]